MVKLAYETRDVHSTTAKCTKITMSVTTHPERTVDEKSGCWRIAILWDEEVKWVVKSHTCSCCNLVSVCDKPISEVSFAYYKSAETIS